MQQARDQALRETVVLDTDGAGADERILNRAQYGYDADKQVEEWLLQVHKVGSEIRSGGQA